ncbi:MULTISPECIES: hypothetical protein [Burkholderia]|uniref:hypothetical protein n=1 Tax=Burkholderia TaxID=32008 RepID=UPI000B7A9C2F|nr:MULTISPECIES: hypothetical protein [Burkholderia]MBY4723973.1 hypothetical protein [Burkholderia contaminans]MCI3970813.1 hypothetical protein [Burkholderia sp. HI4860]OXJ04436.1 hypothetical protein CFB48_06710 [Burkholderia sp. AU33647]
MDVMWALPNAHENFFDTERRRCIDLYFRAEDERLGRTRAAPKNLKPTRESMEERVRKAFAKKQPK